MIRIGGNRSRCAEPSEESAPLRRLARYCREPWDLRCEGKAVADYHEACATGAGGSGSNAILVYKRSHHGRIQSN